VSTYVELRRSYDVTREQRWRVKLGTARGSCGHRWRPAIYLRWYFRMARTPCV
jgi:hypothetical protein